MADIFAVAGAKVYIGTTTAAADETDFAADTYTEIGLVETIGDFGDTAADVTFTGLSDQRTQHLKGSFDAGTMQLTCGRDDSDAGQAALISAFASPQPYNFKIEWNDGDGTPDSGSVSYFRGRVMSKSLTNGTGPNNVARRQFNIGISSEILDIPAA